MFNKDSWIEIFDTIAKNKLRTFLSGFTVALGIFIFVILFGFGNGLSNTFQKFFNDDNVNSMFIYPGVTSEPYKGYESGRRIKFDNADLKAIADEFEEYIQSMSPRIYDNALVKYKDIANNYYMRAVSPSHQYNEMTIIMNGRFINDNDIKNKQRYAVIGRLVAQDLFKTTNPIGEYLDIGGRSWRIIGTFQDDGGDREERMIYLPYTTHQKIHKGNDEIDEIVLSYNPEIGYDGAQKLEGDLKKLIKSRKDIDPRDSGGIYISNVADNLQERQQFASVLQLIITFIGIGTLIAGIIGISNIMVFVVKERTKELGIRKAIGASPRSIIAMILQEAIFITTFSGYFGLIIGIVCLNLVGDTLEKDYFITNPYIDMGTAIGATIILIVFGALAGYIPARRAAKIKPIIALRDA